MFGHDDDSFEISTVVYGVIAIFLIILLGIQISFGRFVDELEETKDDEVIVNMKFSSQDNYKQPSLVIETTEDYRIVSPAKNNLTEIRSSDNEESILKTITKSNKSGSKKRDFYELVLSREDYKSLNGEYIDLTSEELSKFLER